MSKQFQAWVEGGGFTGLITALGLFLGFILPVLQAHPEVPWWIPMIVGGLITSIGAVGGGAIANKHLNTPAPQDAPPVANTTVNVNTPKG